MSYDLQEQELTVSQFLDALNVHMRQYRVTVAGEVTGRVNRRGGVTYFSVHDHEEEAVLPCMGFNSILDKLGITLEEGMAVKVSGYPEIWKRSGGMSFKVFGVLLAGEGALKLQFEALKRRLEAEGLFSPEYKKQLPRFIKSIGLITAEGREAQNDFLTHLPRRGLVVDFYDVKVEGASAVEQVVEAIGWFNKYALETEVLVITRGGGSLESLQAFNSEDVVRAIFASRIPVISAIGHERDVTIADFVADVRASTPTHAAKIISDDWLSATVELDGHEQNLKSATAQLIQTVQHQLSTYLDTWKQQIGYQFDLLSQQINDHERKLSLANPELKLKQGYSIVRNTSNSIVKSVANLALDDMLEVQLSNGKIKTKINELS